MKIFNWMQRRFHHSSLKDGLARNVKKAEFITNEADKQSLLKQVALVDVLDGWKYGILTIGTLGLDPLKPFTQQTEYFVLESDEEEVEEIDHNDQETLSVDSDDDDDDDEDNNFNEHEDENPLIFTRFDHNFEDIGSTLEANSEKFDEIMTIDPPRINSSVYGHNDLQRKRKGERITLAELFMADSDMKKKMDSVEIEPKLAKKPSVRAKNGLSFAKKFIPHVGEHSRPIKKIHQLMRRMLKRKIHPELEGKGYKTDNQSKSGIVEVGISKENEISEAVSLLPTHPAAGPTI